MWIPPETKDPVLLHHPTRRSVGYFGAVRLRDGKLVYRRETGSFNAESCFEFFKQLRAVSRCSCRRAVVIIDNVRYHHATLHQEWRESVEPAFKLEFLPPYSPDLNPVERVWKLTRRLATHCKYFPSLEDIIAAVEATFDRWRRGSEVLRLLCAIN
jgi:hypothetical protein